MYISKKNNINPLKCFVGAWIFVFVLYLLGLSDRLYFSFGETLGSLLPIILVFIGGWYSCFFLGGCKKYIDVTQVIRQVEKAKRKIFYLWFFLLFLTLVEFVYSGYVPVISYLKGVSVSHFAFGIPTVHGLVIAGHLFFSIIGALAFLLTRKKIYLLFFFTAFMVGVLVVSRKVFMVSSTEVLVMTLMLNKITLKQILKSLLGCVFLVIIFGLIGSLRTGNDVIERYGGMNSSFTDKVPGVAWVYLYLTTPTHNLVYATRHVNHEANPAFTRTLAKLVPSVITRALGGSTENQSDRYAIKAEQRYWLESPVFNVSTSFIEPYIDMGWKGVIFFILFISIGSSIVYRKASGIFWMSSNCILCSAAILSIYSNNYSNLNFLGQFLWLYLFGLCVNKK